MRRWLAVAALGTVFLVVPANAQRGSGGHGGGFGGHAAMSGGRPSGGFHGGGSGHPGFSHPGFGRPGFGFGGRPFFGSRFHRHSFYPGWGSGWWYGYPWAYADLGWYDNGYASYNPDEQYYPSDYASVSYFQNRATQQQMEIDRLEDEVAHLREERGVQRQPQTEPKFQPTELIFRDKRTEEIQNYAIVGQTLWVLNAERARKIPLADLDIAATQKANEDRGIEFEIPR
jgi:hypothetical protein